MSYINANGRISQKGYDKANTRLNSGQFGLDTKVGKNSILGVAINYSKPMLILTTMLERLKAMVLEFPYMVDISLRIIFMHREESGLHHYLQM
ncbi:Uncharacterised protein [Fusobacterium necrophorum subsp. necrophorum]|nr:Uncharacterised protein [Fusobacterium necrophorum subsp. necrophorum]